MQNGFDAPPDVLLKRFLDIDLRDPHTLSNAVTLLEDRLGRLKAGYRTP